MELDLYDGNFRHISLHSSLEHFPSDAGSIKMFLICITKFIKNKKIDSSKVNKVKDLQRISKTVWKFVSALYNTG